MSHFKIRKKRHHLLMRTHNLIKSLFWTKSVYSAGKIQKTHVISREITWTHVKSRKIHVKSREFFITPNVIFTWNHVSSREITWKSRHLACAPNFDFERDFSILAVFFFFFFQKKTGTFTPKIHVNSHEFMWKLLLFF
jgi:hypothetical protein